MSFTQPKPGATIASLSCAAVFALAATSAHARIEPLSVSVQQDVSYDNNYLRNDAFRRSELISSTTLQLGLDKDLGRQRYTASLAATAQRNRNFTVFDNDGYSGSMSLSSTVGQNGYVSASASASRSLQDPNERTGTRTEQNVTARNLSVFGLLGVYTRLGLSTNLSTSQTRYSLLSAQDRDQVSARLGARYNVTDLLSFDLGVRRSQVELPNVDVSINRINRTDLDLASTWIITGYSNLRSSVAWSSERRPRTAGFDFDGLTGSLSWNFAPRGRTSYVVSVSRDTDNSGRGDSLNFVRDDGLGNVERGTLNNVSQNQLSTALNVGVNHALTSKVNLNGGVAYRRISDTFSGSSTSTVIQLSDITSFQKASTDITSVRAGFTVAPRRFVSMGCSLEAYSRSQSRLGAAYNGESLGCNARLTLD
jgi:hypothetical protein